MPRTLQQVVGPAREQRGLDHVGLVDVLLRQDRAAGRHAADQRQRQLRQAGQRQRELLAQAGRACLVQRAQCVRLQPDAARGAADQFDHALAGQRLQVLLGRVGRAKPSSAAISARVGGAPVRSMALCTRSSICCWRAVSLGLSFHGGSCHGMLAAGEFVQ